MLPFARETAIKVDRTEGLHKFCQKPDPVLHPGRCALEGSQTESDHKHVEHVKADLRYLARLKDLRKIGEHSRDHRDEDHVDQTLPVYLQGVKELIRYELPKKVH